MKTGGQIRQQYKQVKYRARKKFVEHSLKQKPSRCCFIARVSVKDDRQVGLCLYSEVSGDENWEQEICDTSVAKTCPKFCPLTSPEVVKERFARLLSLAETGNAKALGALALHYPDVAALLWVLEPWKEEEKADVIDNPDLATEVLEPTSVSPADGLRSDSPVVTEAEDIPTVGEELNCGGKSPHETFLCVLWFWLWPFWPF